MFLDKLSIKKNNQTIREISFKKGLNLIVDETLISNTDSGNNVGKTTMIRVIDYCLNGKIDKIYKDKETSTENKTVKDFLQSPGVEFKLFLKGVQNQSYEIIRAHDKQPIINGSEKTDSEFKQELNKILFNLPTDKPSLRELLGKFIRIENHQLDNVYKFLYPQTSNQKDVYEYIYLYLFGFPDYKLIKEKSDLNKIIKKTEIQNRGLSHYKTGVLTQIILALDSDIKKIEQQLKDFNISDSVQDDLESLKETRGKISQLSIEISNLDIQIKLSNNTIENLNQTISNIDLNTIKKIYDQAKVYVEGLHKSFEETFNFHNSMISNKIDFVKKTLFSLEQNRDNFKEDLDKLFITEKTLLKKISKKGVLDDLQNYNEKLSSLKEERGEKRGILKEKEQTEKELKKLKQSLSEINSKMSEFQKDLNQELEKFNSSYREISKKLYDEEYVFAYELDNDDRYEFSTSAMPGTVGSGKKKGQIIAFDLAYLKFLETKKANICRFQIHDRLEEVHFNQLKSAFTIANEIDGQFIIPILKERIANLGDIFIEKNKIISLSQNEKFFRI